MRRFFLTVLILSNVFTFTRLYAGGGGENGTEGDEISMVVLDEIFDEASRQWKTTSDVIWNDYSTGLITVKTTSDASSSYDLHSNTLGNLTIKVKSVDVSRTSSEAAVAKMRESLLLDTEERTDNEGGTED